MRRALIPLALVVLAGCGGDDEKDVRAAVDRYVAAVHANDERAQCRDQISQEMLRRFKAAGDGCAESVDADKGKDYTFVVERVWLNDDRAMAIGYSVLRGEKEDDRMSFVREQDGRWRLTTAPPAGLDPTMNDQQRAVAEASFRFAELVRAGDAQRICDELTSRPLKTELRELGIDCARVYFREQIRKLGGPKFTYHVGEVRILKHIYADVDGEAADASMGLRLQFVREADGRWRITR